MVQQKALDRVFASLADPIRRRALVRLGDGPATVGDLAKPAGISRRIQYMTLDLRMTRHLPATPEKVFDAYTDVEQQKIWFNILHEKPDIVEIEVDLRVGGKQTVVRGPALTRCSGRRRHSSRSTDRTGSSLMRPVRVRTATQ